MNTQRLMTSFFGIGFVSFAPGTLASFTTSILILLFSNQNQRLGFLICLFFLLIFSLVTLFFSKKTIDLTQKKDPSEIVSDEVAGQALAILALPLDGTFIVNTGQVLFAFAIFRILDISKPPPISTSEKISGPVGILIDDLIAGLITGFILIAISPLLGWS